MELNTVASAASGVGDEPGGWSTEWLYPLTNVLLHQPLQVWTFDTLHDPNSLTMNIRIACLLTSLSTMATNAAFGQLNHERSARWGANLNDAVACTALAPDGAMLLSGTFTGTIDLDPGAGEVLVTAVPAGTENGFVVKLAADGSFGWGFAVEKAALPAGVAFTPAGQALIAWSFNGQVDIDPGPGQQLTPATGNHTAVQRLDGASGALVGHLVLSSPVNQFFASQHTTLGLEAAADGGFALHGTFGDSFDLDPGPAAAVVNTNGGADTFVARYAADMTFAWGFGLGGSGNFTDQSSELRFDADGSVYVGGFFNSGTDLDPGPAQAVIPPASTGRDACVAKYAADGSYVWHARMLSPGSSDNILGLEVDQGEVLVMGRYETSVDVDPGAGTQNLVPITNQDGTYLVKLAASTGDLITAAQFDQLLEPAGGAATNSHRRCMAYTGDGHFVIAAELQFGTYDMRIGPGATNLQPNNGVRDIALARYAWDDFTLTGALRIGGASGSDACHTIAANGSGQFLLGGSFRSSSLNVNPDGGPVNLSNAGNTSSSDGFIARYTWPSSSMGVATIPTSGSMVFPNPFTDRITITGNGVGQVHVLDALGRVVLELQGAMPMHADLGALPEGTYIARVKDVEGLTVMPIVKR